MPMNLARKLLDAHLIEGHLRCDLTAPVACAAFYLIEIWRSDARP